MNKRREPAFWLWILLALLIGLIGLAVIGLITWWGSSGASAAPQPDTTTPSATVVLPSLETATLTPVAEITALPPNETSTPEPTSTSTHLPTLTAAAPTPEPKPFGIQVGSPVYTRAFNHTDEGCRWLGVAGQVFGQDGATMNDVAVLVTGTVEEQRIEFAVVTTETSAYGPGGYEIQLTNELPGSPLEFVIQLYDLKSQPLSEPLIVRWPKSCEQNLVLLNFQASSAVLHLYLPIIIQ